MKKYIIPGMFIVSSVAMAYSTTRFVKSVKLFNDIIDNIDFQSIRKEYNRVIDLSEIRRA
jgi:hypothetical protein